MYSGAECENTNTLPSIYTCFLAGNEPLIIPARNGKKEFYKEIRDDEIWNSLQNCFKHDCNDRIYFDVEKATKISFPSYKGVIFISHSHQARKTALRLKEKMEAETGVFCFVDSEVWANAYRIRDDIAIKLSYDDKREVYLKEGYDKISGCIYFMLLLALQEVIRRSFAFIYIPSDINEHDWGEQYTDSPWLSEELFTSSLIPQDRQVLNEKIANFAAFDFKFKAYIQHLNRTILSDFIGEINNRIN